MCEKNATRRVFKADVRLLIEALWVRITLIFDSFKHFANLAIIYQQMNPIPSFILQSYQWMFNWILMNNRYMRPIIPFNPCNTCWIIIVIRYRKTNQCRIGFIRLRDKRSWMWKLEKRKWRSNIHMISRWRTRMRL